MTLPIDDAESLALHDGAHERLQVRRVDAVAQVVEGLGERRAHALLLEREAHLLPQRAAEAVGAHLQRGREADAGLEAHDELVDEVRDLALDLGGSRCPPGADEVSGSIQPQTASSRRAPTRTEAAMGYEHAERRQQSRRQDAVAEDRAGDRGVHAGADQERRRLRLAAGADALRRPRSPSRAAASRCAPRCRRPSGTSDGSRALRSRRRPSVARGARRRAPPRERSRSRTSAATARPQKSEARSASRSMAPRP